MEQRVENVRLARKPFMWPVFRPWSLNRGSSIKRPPVLKGQNFWSPAWPLNTGFTVLHMCMIVVLQYYCFATVKHETGQDHKGVATIAGLLSFELENE